MNPRRLALALSALVVAACASPDPRETRPDVVLIVVDALRADHLGFHGYARDTSPALDRLASESAVFEAHISHSGQTVPATLSLMMSQLPAEHGFVVVDFGENPPYYPDSYHFLQEVFREAGFETAGFVANPHLDERTGFEIGFEHYQNDWTDAATLNGRAIAWIGSQERSRPYFLYLHYIDVHSPYVPHPGYEDRFDHPGGELVYANGEPESTPSPEDLATTQALYDAGIRYVDDQIGRLVEWLRDEGRLDRTILVVTSDHGDAFYEHGHLGHGTTLYGELLRIPLLIRYPPAVEPGRRRHLSAQIDVAPTLLRLTGIPLPASFRGTDVFQEPKRIEAQLGDWVAIHSSDHKLVHNRAEGRFELYAMSDALDLVPLEDPRAREGLADAMERYLELEPIGAARRPGGARAWSEEQIEQLRALGYVD